MDMNWTDPQMVSLYERLAGTIQKEYQDSLTINGIVVDPEYLGTRAAAEILAAASAAQFGTAAWTLGFTPDHFPHRAVFCAECTAGEGELHHDYCKRYGRVMRAPDVQVVL